MENKTFELEIKELTEEGKFSGYLSTFGNVDAGGDVVEPGAFKKTLREKKTYPLFWQHQGTPDAFAGSFSGKEDAVGLKIDGGFALDLESGIKAYKTAKAVILKGISLGLSMGYKAVKFEFDKIKDITVRRLKEVALKEGSLTFFPMNEQAQVVAIKEQGNEVDLELKPMPNNHACVIDASLKVVGSMTRKHDGKEYTVRIGKKEGGGSGDHSYLYPKDTWTEAEARAHCKEHDGSFEAATGKSINIVCKSCGETLTLTEPDVTTQPKAEPLEPTPEPANYYSVVMAVADKINKSN
jgi:HK97 family phage prohead protease